MVMAMLAWPKRSLTTLAGTPVTEQTQPSAAGRRDPPEISDTEEVTFKPCRAHHQGFDQRKRWSACCLTGSAGRVPDGNYPAVAPRLEGRRPWVDQFKRE
jgi:hypothetical protein